MHERLTINPLLADEDTLRRAVAVLKEGHVIIYPTDTLYGIGVDPGNEAALQRVQRIKRRFEPKPLLLIASSLSSAETVVRNFPPAALRLAKEFWPGPLTMILPAIPTLSSFVTQGTGTVGLRIPSSTFCLQLTEHFDGPITSTSANISGERTPDTIDEIESIFGDDVDLYLDAGPLPTSPPSTIVDVSGDFPRLVRQGVISQERLHQVLPEIHA